MNSGVLDLKTRRNVNLAPAAAGTERIRAPAVYEGKTREEAKTIDLQGSKSKHSRKERIKKVLIVSIRCVKKVVALRSARELQPKAPCGISPAIWCQEDHNAGEPAPSANGTAR